MTFSIDFLISMRYIYIYRFLRPSDLISYHHCLSNKEMLSVHVVYCFREKRIWMTYKQGVYDVTDYVVEHPGLDQILLAAGTSVEPFWKVMAVHYHAHSLRTMEKMRIGKTKNTACISFALYYFKFPY